MVKNWKLRNITEWYMNYELWSMIELCVWCMSETEVTLCRCNDVAGVVVGWRDSFAVHEATAVQGAVVWHWQRTYETAQVQAVEWQRSHVCINTQTLTDVRQFIAQLVTNDMCFLNLVPNVFISMLIVELWQIICSHVTDRSCTMTGLYILLDYYCLLLCHTHNSPSFKDSIMITMVLHTSVCIVNEMGPSSDTCGMPPFKKSHCEHGKPFTHTRWCLWNKNDSYHLHNNLGTDLCCDFSKRMLLSTKSNALWKSTKTVCTDWSASN